jgi:RNA-directed DNA polymerase
MTIEFYKEEFTKKALATGFSADNIEKCLEYAQVLLNNGLPVIYDITHLSALVGYKTDYLKRAAFNSVPFYRMFEVLKRKGGVRVIAEPLPSLKEIQLWILEHILYRVEVNRFAKAYVPKLNLKNNVSYHKNKDYVLTLDIVDFFPSIKLQHVQQIFISFGYSVQVSNMLSKLCTVNKSLPQGAPTSPYLSNLYLRNFDQEVSSYCIANKIHYTRYADDLSFSGNFDSNALVEEVRRNLEILQLKLNQKKQHLMSKNQRQIVTGIVVNEKINLPREKRKKIRQSMYYIQEYGLENHLKKNGITKSNYLLHLLGQINFVLFLQHKNLEFQNYKKILYGMMEQ